nr:hypothetical protein [Tanacetum cinerariifolium]
MSEAVTVDRARKTEQNAKRRAKNANTVKSYSSLKERKKRKGLKLQYCERSKSFKKKRISKGRIEAIDSDGHMRSCPSGSEGVHGSRGIRRYDRLAGTHRIRVGSWNVWSLTSKLFELSDTLGRHKVDIACFQETKWKGSRAREGNGYKLWYSGSSTARNGVGVMVARRLKENVVRMTRRSDRIMTIYAVIDRETVNVISAYASQVGLSDVDKKRFWDALDELVRECPTDEQLFIEGDLNGHIGAVADGYAGVHRGFSFGDRNEEGRSIIEFDTAHDLVVANSFFMKSDAHLITFLSGGYNTQIDNFLICRSNLKACKDCRAFPGEACSSRHIPVIVDVLFEKQRHRRRATGRPRILWKNLKGEVVESFRATISEKLLALEEDMSAGNADQMWNTLAGVIRDAAKESLGVATTKQARFKELLSCRDGNQEDIDMVKERSKVSKREAKIVVTRAKDKAYEDLYKKLDSKEGANDIYKIAKARERRRRDIGNVRYIKDEGESSSIESRPDRKGELESSRPQMHYDCYYSRINQEEVRFALQKIGSNKSVGPDQFPIEAWRKKYRLDLKNDMPPRDKRGSLLCHNQFTLSEALEKKQASFRVSDDMSMTYTSFLLGKALPLLLGSA